MKTAISIILVALIFVLGIGVIAAAYTIYSENEVKTTDSSVYSNFPKYNETRGKIDNYDRDDRNYIKENKRCYEEIEQYRSTCYNKKKFGCNEKTEKECYDEIDQERFVPCYKEIDQERYIPCYDEIEQYRSNCYYKKGKECPVYTN